MDNGNRLIPDLSSSQFYVFKTSEIAAKLQRPGQSRGRYNYRPARITLKTNGFSIIYIILYARTRCDDRSRLWRVECVSGKRFSVST